MPPKRKTQTSSKSGCRNKKKKEETIYISDDDDEDHVQASNETPKVTATISSLPVSTYLQLLIAETKQDEVYDKYVSLSYLSARKKYSRNALHKFNFIQKSTFSKYTKIPNSEMTFHQHSILHSRVSTHGFNKPVFLRTGHDRLIGTAFIANLSSNFLLLTCVNVRSAYSDFKHAKFILCELRVLQHITYSKEFAWHALGANNVYIEFEMPRVRVSAIDDEEHKQMKNFRQLRKNVAQALIEYFNPHESSAKEYCYHLIVSYLVPVKCACEIEPETIVSHFEQIQHLTFEDVVRPGNASHYDIVAQLRNLTPIIPMLYPIIMDYLLFIENAHLGSAKKEFLESFTKMGQTAEQPLDYGNPFKRSIWCIGDLYERNHRVVCKLCEPENQETLIETILNLNIVASNGFNVEKSYIKCDILDMFPTFEKYACKLKKNLTESLYHTFVRQNIQLFQVFFSNFSGINDTIVHATGGGNQLIHYAESFRDRCNPNPESRSDERRMSTIVNLWTCFL